MYKNGKNTLGKKILPTVLHEMNKHMLLLLLLHDSIHAIVKRLNVTTTRDSRCGRRNKRDLEIPSRFSCSASNSIKSTSLSLYLSILLAFSFEARASVCKRVAPNRHQDTVCVPHRILFAGIHRV